MAYEYGYSNMDILTGYNGDDEIITLPANVKAIHQDAFKKCRVKKITLPAGVNKLSWGFHSEEECAIRNISNLECIEVDPGNETFYADGVCLYRKDPASGDKITLVATAKVKSLTIANEVTNVCPAAFTCNDNLEEIMVSPGNKTFYVKNNGLYKRGISPQKKAYVSLVGVIKSKSKKFVVADETDWIGDSDRDLSRDPYMISMGGLEAGAVFAGNDVVEEVVFPDSVTGLFAGAFTGCSHLRSVVGRGISTLGIVQDSVPVYHGRGCFEGCSSLEKLQLGDIREVSMNAFKNARMPYEDGFAIIGTSLLKCDLMNDSLVIPEGVVSILAGALPGGLDTVTLPDSVRYIDKKAFGSSAGDMPQNMNVPEGYFDSLDSGDPEMILALLDTIWESEKTVETYVKLFVNQSNNKVIKECKKMLTPLTEEIVGVMVDAISDGNPARDYKKIVKLIAGSLDVVTEELAGQIAEALEKAGAKTAYKQLVKAGMTAKSEKTEDAEKLAKGDRPDEAEVIRFVADYWKSHDICQEVVDNFGLNETIHFKDSHIICDVKIVQALLNEYAVEFLRNSEEEWGLYNSHRELRNGEGIISSQTADYIAGYLNGDELAAALRKLAYGRDYRHFILAYCRFMPDAWVSPFITKIKNEGKGNARARYWAHNAHEALLLNESAEAVKYFDSKKQLDRYASMRGFTAQDIRDMKIVPDFCSDPEKIKADPEAYKKELQKYIETKTDNLRLIHLDGTSIQNEIWNKIYFTNSLLKPLACSLIWMDQNGVTFIPAENGLVRADGSSYSTTSRIRLAHVVEMAPADIETWQNYLSGKGITQPFEQIWEPVFRADQVDVSKRYAGLHLTAKERSALKKALKSKGIDVYSDDMEAEYNHREGTYEFSDHNIMHMGKYVSFSYSIQEDKSITLERGFVRDDSASARYLNAILPELEKRMK